MWEIIGKFILPALLTGGVLGAWIGWLVEKRRKRLEYRISLVRSWRESLLPEIARNQVTHVGGGGPRYSFTHNPAYASLRPHLSADLVTAMEGRTVTIFESGNALHNRFIQEIGRIERKWGLV